MQCICEVYQCIFTQLFYRISRGGLAFLVVKEKSPLVPCKHVVLHTHKACSLLKWKYITLTWSTHAYLGQLASLIFLDSWQTFTCMPLRMQPAYSNTQSFSEWNEKYVYSDHLCPCNVAIFFFMGSAQKIKIKQKTHM